MKKLIVLLVALVCVFGLVGCNKNETVKDSEYKHPLKVEENGEFKYPIKFESNEDTDTNTLEVMENTVAEIGRGTLKTAVELSEEDANILARIINNGSWIEEPNDCENDCVINLKGHLTYYHSNTGTLNKYNLAEMSTYSSKVQEINGKSLVLSEEDRTTVNVILQKYITLTTDNKPTE